MMQQVFVVSACLLSLSFTSVNAFHASMPSSRLRKAHGMQMSAIDSNNLLVAQLTNKAYDFLGAMPLCLDATAKTTTIDDPTAGMSPEEITDYMSNVGGGMCGYPDWVRTAIGLGLNVSLLFFGIFTIGYVILGGYEFALRKGVEESIKKMPQGEKLFAMSEKAEKQGALFNSNAGSSFSTQAMNMDPMKAAQMVPDDTSFDNMPQKGGIKFNDEGGFDMDIDAKGNIYDRLKAKSNGGDKPLSREERRLAKRLGKGDNKKAPNPNKY